MGKGQDNSRRDQVQVPRDRNSEFDPLVLPKGQTTTAKVESVITSLYAKGRVLKM
ncbi:MAG: transposase [Saprospiraceae bacterium]|nr:transposase [Saprospiraceae bacterium]